MNLFYPNDLDIHGFVPVEKDYKSGDWVTDANTGASGKVTYLAGTAGVYIFRTFYPIAERKEQEDESNIQKARQGGGDNPHRGHG